MTTTLTATQLADLRADLDDSGSVLFTDAELQRLYARASYNYDGTIALALRQLLTSAAKMTRYTQGASSEARDQIFAHLKELTTFYEQKAGIGGGVITSGTIDLDLDQDTSGADDYALDSRISEWVDRNS